MKGPVFTSRLASLSSSNLFLRRQLWVWPLIAAALLTAVALFARSSIESALRQSLTDQLEAVLKTDVTALEFWLSEQKAIVSGIARDPEVVKVVGTLVADAQGLPADQIREQLPGPITAMRTEMKGYVESHGYLGFMVIDLDKRIMASSYDELIGLKSPPGYTICSSTRPWPAPPASRGRSKARSRCPTAAAACGPACRR